jgi:hypothetical protein
MIKNDINLVLSYSCSSSGTLPGLFLFRAQRTARWLRPVFAISLASLIAGCASNDRAQDISGTPSVKEIRTLGDVIQFNTEEMARRGNRELFADLDSCLKNCPDADRPHVRHIKTFFRAMSDLDEKHHIFDAKSSEASLNRAGAQETLAVLAGVSENIVEATRYISKIYLPQIKFQRTSADFIHVLSPAVRFRQRDIGDNPIIDQLWSWAEKNSGLSPKLSTPWYVLARLAPQFNRTDTEQLKYWKNCVELDKNQASCQRGLQKALVEYQKPVCDLKSQKLESLVIACEAKSLNNMALLKKYRYLETDMYLDLSQRLQIGDFSYLRILSDEKSGNFVELGLTHLSSEKMRDLAVGCQNYRLGLGIKEELLSAPTLSSNLELVRSSGRVVFKIESKTSERVEALQSLNTKLCEEKTRPTPQ